MLEGDRCSTHARDLGTQGCDCPRGRGIACGFAGTCLVWSRGGLCVDKRANRSTLAGRRHTTTTQSCQHNFFPTSLPLRKPTLPLPLHTPTPNVCQLTHPPHTSPFPTARSTPSNPKRTTPLIPTTPILRIHSLITTLKVPLCNLRPTNQHAIILTRHHLLLGVKNIPARIIM